MVNEINNKDDDKKKDSNIKDDDDNFSSEEDEEVYNTPNAILKNLYIAKDGIVKDETFGLISRNVLSKQVANQICFYVYCALRPFLTSPKQSPIPPTILLIGTGFVGSTVLKQLIDCECKPLIRIYSRGDAQTQHWSNKQVKCGTSIAKLLKNHPADIIIMCSELTSTNSICKQLIPFIKPHTFFITSTFGLQRTRLFSLLKIPCIFRTYQDPDALVNKYKDNYAFELEEKAKGMKEKQNETQGGFNLLNPGEAKDQEMTLSRRKQGKESVVERRLREAKEKEQKNKELGIVEEDDSDDDITKTNIDPSLLDDDDDEDDDDNDDNKQDDLNELEISADLIGKRLTDIRHLVFLLENYYALRGVPHARARREALISIFGYVDEFESTCPVPLAAQKYMTAQAEENKVETETLESESKMNESVASKDGGSHHTKKIVPPVRELLLLKIMQSLFNTVADTFQKQLSKYILVVDLPQALELGSLSELDTVSSVDINDKIFDELSEMRSLLRTPPPPEPIHSDMIVVHILEQDRKLSKASSKIKNLIKSLGISSDEDSDLDVNIYDGYVEEEEDETPEDEVNDTIDSTIKNNKFKLTTSSSPKKLTSFVDGDIAVLSKLEQKERDKSKSKKKKGTGKLSRGSNSRGGNSRGEVKTTDSAIEGMIDIRNEMPSELDTPRRNAVLRAGHIVEHNVQDATTILRPPLHYNIAATKNIKAMFIKEPPKENIIQIPKDRLNYFSNDFVDDSLSQLSAPHPEAPHPKG